MPTLYDNIPLELRERDQWVLWRAIERDDGSITKKPVQCNGMGASVNDPSTWCSFSCAVECADNFSGIGYVFSKDDPYCGIDLDNPFKKDGDNFRYDNPKGEVERLNKIIEKFQSYAEYSPSGTGIHIIVKAKINGGTNPSKYPVEIYDKSRYFTFSGNLLNNSPIVEYQNEAETLYNQLKQVSYTEELSVGLRENVDQFDEDIVIYNRAAGAADGEKFKLLWQGELRSAYKSLSERDLALMNILAYYTQNHQQLARMFRQSALGLRNKANDDRYIYNQLIRMALDQQPPVYKIDMSGMVWDQSGAAQADGDTPTAPEITKPAKAEIGSVTSAAFANLDRLGRDFKYEPPAGMLGDIAQFVYDQAPRPVREIALAASIGLMAGICGQAYNVSSTGLNQYVLVLAMTGAGKEAAASGISKLVHEVVKNNVSVMNEFIGPSEIASAAALIKYMGGVKSTPKPSILTIAGEFGLRLQQLSHHKAQPVDIGIRRLLLDIYNKSGQGQVLRGMIYSDNANNVPDVYAPAFTLLGESTPERFYGAIDQAMVSEGLLPRFSLIEYKGKRPPFNHNHDKVKPSLKLIEDLSSLAAGAKTFMSNQSPIVVPLSPEAQTLANALDAYSDWQINHASDEVDRQLWNRTHIKALKLAALAAVGVHRANPLITLSEMEWAVGFAIRDVQLISTKFKQNEIGKNNATEFQQVRKLMEWIAEYIYSPFGKTTAKGDAPDMHSQKIFLASNLNRRMGSANLWNSDRMGASFAFKRAIKSLVDMGYTETASLTHTKSEAYRVIDEAPFKELWDQKQG